MGYADLLIHTATIQRAAVTAATYSSGGTKTWSDLKVGVQCRVEPLSARERLLAEAEAQYRTHRMYVLPADAAGVTEAGRVFFDNRYFQIVGLRDWRLQVVRIDLLELPQPAIERVRVCPVIHMQWGQAGAWHGFADIDTYMDAMCAEMAALGFKYFVVAGVWSARVIAMGILAGATDKMLTAAATHGLAAYIHCNNAELGYQGIGGVHFNHIYDAPGHADSTYSAELMAYGDTFAGVVYGEEWRDGATLPQLPVFRTAVTAGGMTKRQLVSVTRGSGWWFKVPEVQPPYPQTTWQHHWLIDGPDEAVRFLNFQAWTSLRAAEADAMGILTTLGGRFQVWDWQEGQQTYDQLVYVYNLGYRAEFCFSFDMDYQFAVWNTGLWDPAILDATQDYSQARMPVLLDIVRFNSEYGEYE